MNILFVQRFLPHARVRDSGGQDVYHYIAALSERHTIALIAFQAPGEEPAFDSMRSQCDTVVAVPYQPRALLSRLWRAGWRLLLPRVYGRVVSPRYGKTLRGLLDRSSFDVVIVDGMMGRYGRLVHGAKKVLDEVDVYAVVAYHMYRNERNRLKRARAKMDWLRQQAYELGYFRKYDGVIVRSEQDRALVRSFAPDQNVATVWPWFEGVDALREIEVRRPEQEVVLFVGAMDLPANVEAVHYFAEAVFPLVRQRLPEVELQVVGAAPVPSVRRLASDPHIVVTGEVEDLTPYYENCAVNVVPLLRGGGMIVKTLNGMAAARPTVATAAGISGTGARPGRDLIVVDDDPAAFARAVGDLLEDRVLWEMIARNGRSYVLGRFNWSDNVRKLEEFLQSLTTVSGPTDRGDNPNGLLNSGAGSV